MRFRMGILVERLKPLKNKKCTLQNNIKKGINMKKQKGTKMNRYALVFKNDHTIFINTKMDKDEVLNAYKEWVSIKEIIKVEYLD